MSEGDLQGVKKRPLGNARPIISPSDSNGNETKPMASSAKKTPFVDDLSLFMAWHNWCMAEQNRFLTDFSMYQFSQNQLLQQQQKALKSSPSSSPPQHTVLNRNAAQNNMNETPQSVVVTMASFKRRFAAELIDFFFLLFVKIFVLTYVLDDLYNNRLQYILVIDENTTIEDLQMTLLQALLFRVVAIAYEGYCLSGTLPFSNGLTIGKYLMELAVIRCEIVEDIDAAEGRIRVYPGGPLGALRSMVRTTLKNFIISLFFPMLLIFQLISSHKRLIYEQAAGTIVIKRDNY